MIQALRPFTRLQNGIARTAVRIGVAAMLAVAALPGMAQTPVDEALLTIERPDAFYSQMPVLAGAMSGPVLEVADKKSIPALVQQGGKLAKTAFDNPQAMRDIRAAMAKTPDPGAVGKDLPAIAARFREHEAVLDDMSLEQAQAAGDKYDAQLNARADKDAIQKISNAMAAPLLASEVMVTGKRLKWIYESIIAGNKEKLRAMPTSELQQGVGEILAQSRDTQDEQPGPFMVQLTTDAWRLRKQAVLAQLSAQDIAALQAFYQSAAGRARRDAIVTTFVTHNDRAGRAVLTGLLKDIQ